MSRKGDHNNESDAGWPRKAIGPMHGARSRRTAPIRLLLALILTATAPLVAQNKTERPAGGTRAKDDFTIVPLPWFLASSDLGVGPVLALVLTDEDGIAKPYLYQAFFVAARTNLGFENLAFKIDRLNFTRWGLRLKVTGGYIRNLQDHYFGYGNRHDLNRENGIESGRIPVGPNLPQSPDVIQGEEVSLNRRYLSDPQAGLNPGRRHLRESQNKYFQFDSVQRSGQVSVEKRLGPTPWILKVGAEGGAYRILSYKGDRENNNTVTNIPTLLDLERPLGYDATEKMRYINVGELALHYDTRPSEREMHPDRGVFAGVKVGGGGHGVGSDYTFARAGAFAHYYTSPFREFLGRHGKELNLAFRGLASQNFGGVPFFFAQSLGSRSLRGYPDRQFIDRVMLMSGAEARFTFARIAGADFILFAFAEQGRVGAGWREIDGSGWHRATGGGLDVFIGGNTLIEIVSGSSKYKEYYEVSIGHTFVLE